MKPNRIYLFAGLLAVVAVLTATLSPDALAVVHAIATQHTPEGLMMLAIAPPALAGSIHAVYERKEVGDDDAIQEIAEAIEAQGKSFLDWKDQQGKRFDAYAKAVDELLKKSKRPDLSTGDRQDAPPMEMWLDTKSGQRVPVLEAKHSLLDLGGGDTGKANLGRALRGMILGSRASDAKELAEEAKALGISSDPSGGYTVSGMLASAWIDRLRAAMVLNLAGARTVPMDTSSLTLAKVTGDPVIAWHGENALLTASDASFGAVTLQAKTAVCLVKMSLELSQDSSNIEDILSRTITNAMAHALDAAGLVGVAIDAGAAPMTGAGVMNLAARNTVTSIGAPTSWDFLVDGMYELLADDVQMESIGAFIAHPAVWKKLRKLKTGIASDNTPLTMPEEIARLPKLWTTAAPLAGGTTAKGIVADWRDLLFGVRKDITVRVLQETFLGSNLQLALLAYVRCDFAATRANSFCTLEGITV